MMADELLTKHEGKKKPQKIRSCPRDEFQLSHPVATDSRIIESTNAEFGHDCDGTSADHDISRKRETDVVHYENKNVISVANSSISDYITYGLRMSGTVSKYFKLDGENKANPAAPVISFNIPIKKKRRRSSIFPTPEDFHDVVSHLSLLHPYVVQKNHERRQRWQREFEDARKGSMRKTTPITDAVISTMLSQNTTDTLSREAFENLKKEFPSWDDVLVPSPPLEEDTSPEEHIVDRIRSAIKVAGLSPKRSRWIYNILLTVKNERKERSGVMRDGKVNDYGVDDQHLEYLRHFSDQEVKEDLLRFPGIGPKTVSCVLLFALHRPEFPVDTHVLRISRALGWVPSRATREAAYKKLNLKVPHKIKLDLHCLLVEHGKVCHRCAKNGRPQFPPAGGKLDCRLKIKQLQHGAESSLEENKNPVSVPLSPN
uniref:HhH-GPD domain-containing protein n=1 Tax=Corethron hystrix TaxID=216773 RepID=A0A7S1BPT7_9STRA